MDELVLTRSGEDRRRFDLAGLGSLHKAGGLSSAAEISLLDGTVLTAERQGIFRTTMLAKDGAGTVVGEFRTRPFSSGGDLVWLGTTYVLKSERWWGGRYVLSAGDQPVVRFRCSGWGGRTPVQVTLEGPRTDAGLVLFMTWGVQRLVADAASAGGAA